MGCWCGLWGGFLVEGAEEVVELFALCRGDGGDGFGAAVDACPGVAGLVVGAVGGGGYEVSALASCFGDDVAVGGAGKFLVSGDVGAGEAVDPVVAAGG